MQTSVGTLSLPQDVRTDVTCELPVWITNVRYAGDLLEFNRACQQC